MIIWGCISLTLRAATIRWFSVRVAWKLMELLMKWSSVGKAESCRGEEGGRMRGHVTTVLHSVWLSQKESSSAAAAETAWKHTSPVQTSTDPVQIWSDPISRTTWTRGPPAAPHSTPSSARGWWSPVRPRSWSSWEDSHVSWSFCRILYYFRIFCYFNRMFETDMNFIHNKINKPQDSVCGI